ncbi:E3 ubiquitin-protein ligase [Dirofilaria immitis]
MQVAESFLPNETYICVYYKNISFGIVKINIITGYPFNYLEEFWKIKNARWKRIVIECLLSFGQFHYHSLAEYRRVLWQILFILNVNYIST